MKLRLGKLPISFYTKKVLLFYCVMQFLLLVVICTFITIKENRDIHKNSAIDSSKIMSVFLAEIKQETNLLEGLMPIIKRDSTIKEAWLGQNRSGLYESTKDLFEYFRQRFNVTHFYFHKLNGINFLRVHAPERYGDNIKRFTMLRAQKQKRNADGTELGPFGSIALRLVSPWTIDGKLVGYIELGMEIDHIINHLEKTQDVGLAIIIRKAFVNKQLWEEGQHYFSTVGDWDIYNDYLVTDIRNAPLPPTIFFRGKKPSNKQDFAMQLFKSNGKHFCVIYRSLFDAGNREVGYLSFVNDYSEELEELKIFLFLITAVFICASVALYAAFYYIMAHLESSRLGVEKEREKLIEKLNIAITEIKTLQGIVPICSYCKKIRDDKGFWNQVDAYLSANTEAEFSHSICPDCYEKVKEDYENALKEIKK